MTDPNPRGIRVIHEGPGAPIEVAMWWMDGRPRVTCWLTDKQALVLLADLAAAVRKNNAAFGSDEPRSAEPSNKTGD